MDDTEVRRVSVCHLDAFYDSHTGVWGPAQHSVLTTALHEREPRRAAQRTENNRARFRSDDVRQLSTAIGLHLEKVNRNGEHSFSAHDDTSEVSDLRVWSEQTGRYLWQK